MSIEGSDTDRARIQGETDGSTEIWLDDGLTIRHVDWSDSAESMMGGETTTQWTVSADDLPKLAELLKVRVDDVPSRLAKRFDSAWAMRSWLKKQGIELGSTYVPY